LGRHVVGLPESELRAARTDTESLDVVHTSRIRGQGRWMSGGRLGHQGELDAEGCAKAFRKGRTLD
jgi:hypothetical protein